MNLTLHIERLVLDGLPLGPGQSRAVAAVVEAELARLLAERGLNPALRGGGAWPSARAGGIQLRPASHGAALGQQIARAVFGAIGAEAAPDSRPRKGVGSNRASGGQRADGAGSLAAGAPGVWRAALPNPLRPITPAKTGA